MGASLSPSGGSGDGHPKPEGASGDSFCAVCPPLISHTFFFLSCESSARVISNSLPADTPTLCSSLCRYSVANRTFFSPPSSTLYWKDTGSCLPSHIAPAFSLKSPYGNFRTFAMLVWNFTFWKSAIGPLLGLMPWRPGRRSPALVGLQGLVGDATSCRDRRFPCARSRPPAVSPVRGRPAWAAAWLPGRQDLVIVYDPHISVFATVDAVRYQGLAHGALGAASHLCQPGDCDHLYAVLLSHSNMDIYCPKFNS